MSRFFDPIKISISNFQVQFAESIVPNHPFLLSQVSFSNGIFYTSSMHIYFSLNHQS